MTIGTARDSWLVAAARFACEVPTETVERVADCLQRNRAGEALALLSGDAARLLVELLHAWNQGQAVVDTSDLAIAIQAASKASSNERARQQVELVWSGPSTLSSTLRSTGPALLELIERARESLYVVAFAAYKVPAVVGALAAAEARGVRVVFVVESDGISGGKVDFDPLPHLGGTSLMRAEVYVWPVEQRLRDERGRFGTLHAKFAVADRRRLLVSSANLTEYALSLNIELGVMISGGVGPAEAARHVDELIRLGVLKRVR